MTRTAKLLLTCSLCFTGFSCSNPPSLSAVDPAPTAPTRLEALQQELAKMQEEKRQYEQWARYADREADRLMSRDWVEYQEYVRMQERAQAKVEELDYVCKKLEKEIRSLQTFYHIKAIQSSSEEEKAH